MNAFLHVRPIPVICFLALGLLAGSCRRNDEPETPQKSNNPAASLSADVAMQWADMSLRLIRTTPGFTPPVASRALGYAGVALYESVVPGLSEYQSLIGQLNGLSSLPKADPALEYHWGVSANAAQSYLIKNLFANTSAANKTTIDSLEAVFIERYRTDGKLTQEIYDRSAQFGRSIATALFEWSKNDRGHQGYSRNQPTTYTTPAGPGKWIQTTLGDAGRAQQPFWGQNRTFLAANASMVAPAPMTYATSSSSPFFAQALEVYSIGKNLTEEQKTIARFWADGGGTITPPGHSWSIATQALKKANAKLDKAAETYARVGMVVADAFICCWKAKFTFNTVRPVTYIKTVIDPNWQSLIPTPPFPEYMSGHSTQSSATGQVLSDLFGYNFSFSDNTHAGRGFAPRTFKNFFEAAEEAAISRLYGGIHFRQANENGLNEGKKIGRNISAMKFKRAAQ